MHRNTFLFSLSTKRKVETEKKEEPPEDISPAAPTLTERLRTFKNKVIGYLGWPSRREKEKTEESQKFQSIIKHSRNSWDLLCDHHCKQSSGEILT